MKQLTMHTKQFFILVLIAMAFASALSAQAPNFIGLAQGGGSNSNGAIFTFSSATGRDSVRWSFGNGTDGAGPNGNLLYLPGTGLYYGMTDGGGSNAEGTIFSFNAATDSESVLWNFGTQATDGQFPNASLIYNAATGLFYGTTGEGGSSGASAGTIFSFDPATGTDSVLWSFGNGTDGYSPFGNLYQASNGLFYGMTYEGGTNNLGTIFSFNPTTGSESVLWNFGSGNDGASPIGDLIYDPVSHLFYGMTFAGGSATFGAIFSFNPSTLRDSVLWNFGNGTDGSEPNANLLLDTAARLLYGTTTAGGANGTSSGTIFSFNLITGTDSVLWSFGSGSDGSDPMGDLLYYAANGLFYGMTSAGGTDFSGVIFSYSPATGTDSVLWNFGNGADAAYPNGDLMLYAPAGPSCPAITVSATQAGATSAYGGASGGVAPYTYVWSTTPAQNTDTATGLTQGMAYTVTATDHNGCTGSGSISIPLGIAVINGAAALSMYPNPFSGTFTITGLAKGQSIEVYNAIGQKAAAFIIAGTTQQIDLSAGADGVYLIQVFNVDGTLANQQKAVKIN
jgi:uncharacterized repeat protein (TIGR03803 family)